MLTVGSCVLSAHAQMVVYGDDNAAAGGDDMSWLTPYEYLRNTLDAGAATDQIRAAGDNGEGS